MAATTGDAYGDYSGVVEMLFRDDQPETVLFQGAGQDMWLTYDHGMTFTKVPLCMLVLGRVLGGKDAAPVIACIVLLLLAHSCLC